MENRLKEVIAFVNNKGGVAKTTSVQNVAAGMLLKDPTLRILVIDGRTGDVAASPAFDL